MVLDPTTLKPVGPRMLVKLYERPNQIGSIILPDKFRRDLSFTLWEVVKPSAKFNDEVGLELKVDDIVQTLKRYPPYVGDGEDGTAYFIMDSRSCGFRGVTRWKSE